MVVLVGGKNTIVSIDQVLMAVSVDAKDNTEGVCAVQVDDGQWMPLLAADKQREPFIREAAYKLSAATGMTIKLVRLSQREVVEVIQGAAKS